MGFVGRVLVSYFRHEMFSHFRLVGRPTVGGLGHFFLTSTFFLTNGINEIYRPRFVFGYRDTPPSWFAECLDAGGGPADTTAVGGAVRPITFHAFFFRRANYARCMYYNYKS